MTTRFGVHRRVGRGAGTTADSGDTGRGYPDRHRSTRGSVVLGPQGPLEDLAGPGQGQLADDLQAARGLVAGDVALTEGAQLFQVHGGAGGQGDDRVDPFAPGAVGDADHRHLGHGRVLGDDVLDLDRVHVLAAGDDHVLDPVDHVDVAALVHPAAVAGVHPARPDGFGGGPGLLPVAEHDVLAGRDDLPHRAPGHLDVAVVHDLHPGVG